MVRRWLLVFAVLFILVIAPLEASADNEVTGVVINPAALQITYGERDTIYAIVYPDEAINKRVTWTVSDPRLLEISEVYQADSYSYPALEIKALYPGRAVITAVTRDGGFRAQAVVQIVVVPVRSIAMIPPEVAITPMETIQILARVEPAAGTLPFVTFESSNPAVASVNEVGMVMAKQPGETRIIARSVQDNAVSAFSTVTVAEAAVIPVEDNSIDTGSSSVNEGEVTQTLEEEQGIDDEEAAGGLLLWLIIGGLVLLIVAALLIFLKNRGQQVPAGLSSSSHAGKPAEAQNRQIATFSAGVKGIFGQYAGQSIKFHNNRLVIGRDPSAGLSYSLSNEQISRTHLTISYDPREKLFTLVDSSSNGTFLASQKRLEKGVPYRLKAGDQFYLVDEGEMFELQIN
jgi:hypothetical protein